MPGKRSKATNPPQPPPAEKRKLGRPSVWREEFVEEALKQALLGRTNDQLAKELGVNIKRVEEWIRDKPDFRASLKKGRGGADVNVVRSLYERANGYSVKAEKIFMHRGKIIRAEYIEHYPPDTAAAFIWLKNRQGWRNEPPVDRPDDRLDEIAELLKNGPAKPTEPIARLDEIAELLKNGPAKPTEPIADKAKAGVETDAAGAQAGGEAQTVRREGS